MRTDVIVQKVKINHQNILEFVGKELIINGKHKLNPYLLVILVMRKMLPNLFGDEWHIRMQQLQRLLEHVPKDILGVGFGSFAILAIKARFNQFDVPIAQFAPDEIIERSSTLTHIVPV